jgi:hypothetical protein
MRRPLGAVLDAKACLDKTCAILQELHYSGIITSPPTMIPDWSNLPNTQSLSSFIILSDKKHFISTTVEHSKVSLALNHNARMKACGYFYKGHDFGWDHEPGQTNRHNQAWYSAANRDYRLEDHKVVGVIIQYQQLTSMTSPFFLPPGYGHGMFPPVLFILLWAERNSE